MTKNEEFKVLDIMENYEAFLTDWEYDFINSLDTDDILTGKQRDKLFEIHERLIN